MSALEQKIANALWDLLALACRSYDEYHASVVCPSTGDVDAGDAEYLEELDGAIAQGMEILARGRERWRANAARIPAQLAVRLEFAAAWQAQKENTNG